jgi:hypothetical protein
MTNDNTNEKDSTMDNCTFGMFAEADAYNASREAEENWVEPMDWNDILDKNQRHLDEALPEDDDSDEGWEDYDSEDIWD